jgi:hypothetical protein
MAAEGTSRVYCDALAMPPEKVYVVYAPYLPLNERVQVGAWELIPRADLRESDAMDDRAAKWASGFADLFDLREPLRPFGAFARQRDGLVGDDIADSIYVDNLARTLLVTVLDSNQSALTPSDERDPNASHSARTSENAFLGVNGISYEGGWTATRVGSAIPLVDLAVPVDPDAEMPRLPKFPAPAGLPLPSMERSFDQKYAQAAWDSLSRATDAARRIGRAIEWLGLAWLNATGVAPDLRIPAIHAGFETLFDTDEVKVIAHRLACVLEDGTTRTRRERVHPATGKLWSEELSEVEWWFYDFSFLRNDLMHGRIPTRGAWLHDDRGHVSLGESYLRRAIKCVIGLDGHQDILDDIRLQREVRETRLRWREEGLLQ